MELTTPSGKAIRTPTQSNVIQSLDSLDHEDDGFVILAQADEEYVQTAGGAFEYRHDGRHFRAVQTPAPAKLIEQVFVAYLHGQDWTRGADWQDVTAEINREGRKSAARIVSALVLLLAIGLLVAYLRGGG